MDKDFKETLHWTILALSWNYSKKTILSIEKINDFHLFATSAHDKKEYQMSVLNGGGT